MSIVVRKKTFGRKSGVPAARPITEGAAVSYWLDEWRREKAAKEANTAVKAVKGCVLPWPCGECGRLRECLGWYAFVCHQQNEAALRAAIEQTRAAEGRGWRR